MFTRFVKIPGESPTERYNRFIEHQRKANIYGWQLLKDRNNAEKAAKTNFTDLFTEDTSIIEPIQNKTP